MAEAGCLRDVAVQNLEVSGNLNISGSRIDANYALSLSGVNNGSLPVVAATDATMGAVGGQTLASPNVYVNSTATAAAAARVLTLPQNCVPGDVVIFNQGAALGGNTITIQRANGVDGFDTTVPIVVVPTSNAAAANSTDLAVAGDHKVVATFNANGKWGGIGSTITFFCAVAGTWIVRVPTAIGLGNGGDGSTVAFAQ